MTVLTQRFSCIEFIFENESADCMLVQAIPASLDLSYSVNGRVVLNDLEILLLYYVLLAREV